MLLGLMLVFLVMVPFKGWCEEVIPIDYNVVSHETVTVADTAIGFTAATMTPDVKGVFCTLETAQVRFWIDGSTTAPTATVGHLLEVGQTLTILNWAAIRSIMFIRTGGTSGVLQVTFLK